MSLPFKPVSMRAESWLTTIAEMSREELVEQFRNYPAPFPIDFTDEFLAAQSVDKLRHVFAGLVMHCGIAPTPSGYQPRLAAA